MGFSVSEAWAGEWAVVSVTGELDMATAPALATALDSLIEGGHVQVVVDLSGVSFIDSTGLSVLGSRLRKARASGGRLPVVVTESNLLRVFRITGLHEMFPVVASVDEATSAPAGTDAPAPAIDD